MIKDLNSEIPLDGLIVDKEPCLSTGKQNQLDT